MLISGGLHDYVWQATQYFMPLYFQEVRGYSPLQSAVLILPCAFGTSFAGALSGPLLSKLARYVVPSLSMKNLFWQVKIFACSSRRAYHLDDWTRTESSFQPNYPCRHLRGGSGHSGHWNWIYPSAWWALINIPSEVSLIKCIRLSSCTSSGEERGPCSRDIDAKSITISWVCIWHSHFHGCSICNNQVILAERDTFWALIKSSRRKLEIYHHRFYDIPL